jgi:hypothetical protein
MTSRAHSSSNNKFGADLVAAAEAGLHVLPITTFLQLPFIQMDPEEAYEVERILDIHMYRGKLQYRVNWLGYDEDPEWARRSELQE